MRQLAAMTETAALERLAALEIETPSWGYGNSGTRFHVYPVARRRPQRLGADRRRCARPPADRVLPARRDAHPVGPRRGLVGAPASARRAGHPASARSTRTSSATTTTGSGACATPTRASARRRSSTAVSASRSRAGRTRRSSASGSPTARTTRAGRPARAVRASRGRAGGDLPPSPTECACSSSTSFSSPAFYSTDLPDWGTAALLCRRLGPQAQVLVDTGHHPQGTNIEQIVALLLAEGLLGGFHFNNRKYADDDLIVGSIDPFELFRIMREIAARRRSRRHDRVHDRPVAQHRGEDRRDDPVGHEHPDGICQGAPRRRQAARRRAERG